jgi:hypothetical protein
MLRGDTVASPLSSDSIQMGDRYHLLLGCDGRTPPPEVDGELLQDCSGAREVSTTLLLPGDHTRLIEAATDAPLVHPTCGRTRDKTARTTRRRSRNASPNRRPLEPCTGESASSSGWSTRTSPSHVNEPRPSSHRSTRRVPHVDARALGGPSPVDPPRADRRHRAATNYSYCLFCRFARHSSVFLNRPQRQDRQQRAEVDVLLEWQPQGQMGRDVIKVSATLTLTS